MLLVDLKDNGSPGDSQKRGKPGPLGPSGEIMSQPVFLVEGTCIFFAWLFIMVYDYIDDGSTKYNLFFAAGKGANPSREGEREYSEGARQQHVCTLVQHNHYSLLLSSEDSPGAK